MTIENLTNVLASYYAAFANAKFASDRAIIRNKIDELKPILRAFDEHAEIIKNAHIKAFLSK